MESTSANENPGVGVAPAISTISTCFFILASAVLAIIGVVSAAWADQLFTCGPYQRYIDSCLGYPGLENLHDLLFQIWATMLATLAVLNGFVWLVFSLIWIKREISST